MTCYEIICLIIQTISFLILAIVVYSIKERERAAEEEAKRVNDYTFACSRYRTMEQVYKHDAEMYSLWLHFALKYGCNSPEEMRSLIDDLVKKVKRLEVK